MSENQTTNPEYDFWREHFPVGSRVALVSTSDAFTRLEPGAEGTVVRVGWALDEPRVDVDWDGGSKLTMLPYEGDRIRVVA